jgi:hypothetical protein
MDIKDVLEAYLGDLEYNSSSLSRMNYATELGILIPNYARVYVKSLIKTLENNHAKLVRK